MTRFFYPMSHREKAYYHLRSSPDVCRLIPWHDWYDALAPLIGALFPFCLIKPGETAVQVGCCGNFFERHGASQPLLLAKCVGPTGRVIGVEVNPESISALERAKAIAGTPWLELVNYAASDHSGEIQGLSFSGQFTFWRRPDDFVAKEAWDPSQPLTAGRARGWLKQMYDNLESYGQSVTVRAERLETILTEARARPSFINLTLSGYEHIAIRGLGSLLDSDTVIAFPALIAESFWHSGLLDELERHGFTLILSNTPHNIETPWFPCMTAVRPHHLDRVTTLVPGRFVIDPANPVITFLDEAGNRFLAT